MLHCLTARACLIHPALLRETLPQRVRVLVGVLTSTRGVPKVFYTRIDEIYRSILLQTDIKVPTGGRPPARVSPEQPIPAVAFPPLHSPPDSCAKSAGSLSGSALIRRCAAPTAALTRKRCRRKAIIPLNPRLPRCSACRCVLHRVWFCNVVAACCTMLCRQASHLRQRTA